MASTAGKDAQVAVIGGGVVGCAVAHALARHRVQAVLLEAERELGLEASGTNSGILHSGFDSIPGALETELILASASVRDAMVDRLGIPVVRCGAELRPGNEREAAAVGELAERAGANGVPVSLREDGVLEVPGEAVTDPVAYVLALAGAAAAGGVEIRTRARVEAIAAQEEGLRVATQDGAELTCAIAVNCAGLRADEVARLIGDESFEIYPRKGEFFVFEPPEGSGLERILLPVPSERTKGVLVFPTIDGKVVAGPSAHDQDDKDDWSVRPDAAAEVLPKARAMLPALEGSEPIASYAGLRPAGRGANYLIGPSAASPRLINVAAIRSTGLSASLGIAERVMRLLSEGGIELGPPLEPPPESLRPSTDEPWWLRTAHEKVGA
jgi:glycerol-3-phosphate dehydrogenase